MPPSTRAFAKDYAAFYGESKVAGAAYQQAKAIKNAQGGPPSTGHFAKDFAAFYDAGEVNEAVMDQARALKNQGASNMGSSSGTEFRIKTSVRHDPNFRANQARFHGVEAAPEDEIYKNYRAFYGGATPNVHQAGHMGQA